MGPANVVVTSAVVAALQNTPRLACKCCIDDTTADTYLEVFLFKLMRRCLPFLPAQHINSSSWSVHSTGQQ
jgi:hypothetical protein